MPHPWEFKEKFDFVTADFVYVRSLGDRKGIEEQTKTVSTERTNRLDRCRPPATIAEISYRNTLGGSSMLDEGVCAQVKSVENTCGSSRSSTRLGSNVNAKKWIAPSGSVETIEQGKLKAATYAETYLRQVANLELPPLKWKESRAA